MRKLILILLAFLAVFTYIRAFERDEDSVTSTSMKAEAAIEIPVEIVR
jgi:hypothetical protein